VLSTPPAFVLSQDQTLRQKPTKNPSKTPPQQKEKGQQQRKPTNPAKHQADEQPQTNVID
jgi:hypothetical protein